MAISVFVQWTLTDSIQTQQYFGYCNVWVYFTVLFAINTLYSITQYSMLFPPSTLSGTWSTPTVTGERPPPLGGFTLTRIGDNQAVLFGGEDEYLDYPDATYILDLSRTVSCVW